MLVVVRFDPPADLTQFKDQAIAALGALAACRGFQRGWFARSVDQPETWTLVTAWDSVGTYRRALSSYDVKITATPFMYLARDELTAFEPLIVADAGADGAPVLQTRTVDRADDSAQADIGDFGPRPTM